MIRINKLVSCTDNLLKSEPIKMNSYVGFGGVFRIILNISFVYSLTMIFLETNVTAKVIGA